ncbi:hypothetical protein L1987_12532 [Smallanthus sonchifolius]|uniref:Uncharacterized protein n=1 Tax=Smallanthus sonchifolius TaxID=185202 RepID=A0ACB9JGB6_9ASTR|nr:hypothetical protein L1987_12532 [Smallanthus sonchifolius]
MFCYLKSQSQSQMLTRGCEMCLIFRRSTILTVGDGIWKVKTVVVVLTFCFLGPCFLVNINILSVAIFRLYDYTEL